MNDINLYSKLMALPDDLKKEADKFVEYLKSKGEKDYKKKPKIAGLAKGLIKMKKGFDDPLEDFSEYMDS